ncbi:hypothetical protein O3P69_007307 [Scylla paramamosain]|uniref:ATP synthase-coupling factor 6, mitochondrial n=1 Tax=Scylla paramamosain TaxID=85552 RepID=A0AAW0V5D3_SCYPA
MHKNRSGCSGATYTNLLVQLLAQLPGHYYWKLCMKLVKISGDWEKPNVESYPHSLSLPPACAASFLLTTLAVARSLSSRLLQRCGSGLCLSETCKDVTVYGGRGQARGPGHGRPTTSLAGPRQPLYPQPACREDRAVSLRAHPSILFAPLRSGSIAVMRRSANLLFLAALVAVSAAASYDRGHEGPRARWRLGRFPGHPRHLRAHAKDACTALTSSARAAVREDTLFFSFMGVRPPRRTGSQQVLLSLAFPGHSRFSLALDRVLGQVTPSFTAAGMPSYVIPLRLRCWGVPGCGVVRGCVGWCEGLTFMRYGWAGRRGVACVKTGVDGSVGGEADTFRLVFLTLYNFTLLKERRVEPAEGSINTHRLLSHHPPSARMIVTRIIPEGRALQVVLRRNYGVSAVLMKKVADPIQQLFVDKIHEYNQKSKTTGGKLVDATPAIEKQMQQELDKVARQYGGGAGVDMTKFPDFKFEDPKVDMS